MRTADLRQKEVINIRTAERIGFISDIEMNPDTGCIESLIVPVRRGISGLFGKHQDFSVPWDKIITIGKDLVLTELDSVEVVR